MVTVNSKKVQFNGLVGCGCFFEIRCTSDENVLLVITLHGCANWQLICNGRCTLSILEFEVVWKPWWLYHIILCLNNYRLWTFFLSHCTYHVTVKTLSIQTVWLLLLLQLKYEIVVMSSYISHCFMGICFCIYLVLNHTYSR